MYGVADSTEAVVAALVTVAEVPPCAPDVHVSYWVPGVMATGTVAMAVVAAVLVTVLQVPLIFCQVPPVNDIRHVWICSLVLTVPDSLAVPTMLVPAIVGG
jgi:hypothetical protein